MGSHQKISDLFEASGGPPALRGCRHSSSGARRYGREFQRIDPNAFITAIDALAAQIKGPALRAGIASQCPAHIRAANDNPHSEPPFPLVAVPPAVALLHPGMGTRYSSLM